MSAEGRAAAERWMQGYLRAWASDDPDEIQALFTDDATYLTSPFAKPWTGREAIVEQWIKGGDSGAKWHFDYEIVAVDGATAAVRGETTYEATEKDPEKVYANLWIIVLAPDGRATSFEEFWMGKPAPKTA
jgi:uncharacterized protein (TIGR02246 family)